ncbi:MAG: TetR/AcrR family transcriptional regulator [Deltaproteobacteria bacterium]|nr:TetR/AcrR family transcriptional regulator [Deltaproteobacteria bacterium]MBW2392743.1 TetR/AcrR family transcriptional regulator [Deltaproteobacteria bacterium]
MARSAPGTAPSSEATSSDGRARRSERSRQAIVQALMALIGEGSPRPTAQQVAERAGVGIRTVFRHFSDMETLYAEMDVRLRVELRPLLRGGQPEGGLEERIVALVARRADLFERFSPYHRSAALHRWRSHYLRGRHATDVRELRTNLLRWLPELEQRDSELTDAAELATSSEAWDRLRSEQRLSRNRASTVIEGTLRRLLA